MIIVPVYVHVKPEFIDAFKIATTKNARNSVREQRADLLDSSVKEAIGLPGAKLDWIYPPRDMPTRGAREPEGMGFLKGAGDVLSKWREFWPRTGGAVTGARPKALG